MSPACGAGNGLATAVQILQIVVRNRGNGENDRGGEQGVGHERAPRMRPGLDHGEQQCGAGHNAENADAGNRAVGSADQSSHVAADRGDQKSADKDERNGRDHEGRDVAGQNCRPQKADEQVRDHNQT
jgi:hypothetical protein